MKLELKHISPYLPYGLRVQYNGIVNGKEISEYTKEYDKNHSDDMLGVVYESDFDPPKPIRDNKIGYIRVIELWNNFNNFRIGNKKHGLQTHYDTSNFKPILRPLSDLTKEIEYNGEKFVTILKLCEIAHSLPFFTPKQWCVEITDLDFISVKSDKNYYSFSFDLEDCELSVFNGGDMESINDRYELYEKLFEWHFDVFGLIPKGLAIDKNTL